MYYNEILKNLEHKVSDLLHTKFSNYIIIKCLFYCVHIILSSSSTILESHKLRLQTH
jgi:hypothetical protein